MLRQDNDIIRIDYMKKVILFIFLFILTNSFLFGQNFGGGTGTEYDPYRIYTIEHLEELADRVKVWSSEGINWSDGRYFILMDDITDSVRFMIGEDGSINKCPNFQGSFDGNGHKITLALNYPKPSEHNNIGLFSVTSSNVEIKNLIVDGYIRAAGKHIGAIVGNYLYSSIHHPADSIKIKNCINMANIYVTNIDSTYYVFVCGIMGHCGLNVICPGLIEDCINMGDIIVKSPPASYGNTYTYAAGMMAPPFANTSVSINRCMNTGYIQAECVGGIIALPYTIYFPVKAYTITNCINIGVLDGTPFKTGAIVGVPFGP